MRPETHYYLMGLFLLQLETHPQTSHTVLNQPPKYLADFFIFSQFCFPERLFLIGRHILNWRPKGKVSILMGHHKDAKTCVTDGYRKHK